MGMNETIEAWERAGQSDAARRFIAPTDNYDGSGERRAKQLADLVGPHPRWSVLDFGCGDGRVTRELHWYFGEVWGADASRSMLDRFESLCDLSTIQWDGTDPSIVDHLQFDLVCSFLCLTHHRSKDRSKILKGLASVMKPSGIMAIQIPLYEVATEPSGWTSVGTWTPQQFEKAAENAGLKVVEMHTNPGRWRKGHAGPHHGSLHRLHLC